MNEPPEKPWLTIPELCQRWQVSRMTIYREIQRGRLKRSYLGNSVRFSRDEIRRYERQAG